MSERYAKTPVENALVDLFVGRAFVNGGSLIKRVAKKSDRSMIDVQGEFAALAREGILSGIQMNGFPDGRVSMSGITKRPCPSQQAWEEVLGQRILCLTERQKGALRNPGKAILALPPDDQLRLLDGLIDCAASQTKKSSDRYLISARHLLGSSKALDHFSQEIIDAFGIEVQNDDRLLYVITAGPSHPKSIIFIENPSTFTAFARSTLVGENMAVCAYGYGLTFENFGARLRAGSVVPCPAFGEVPVPNLAEALEKAPLFYWGDLDLEGLRIYESMKKHFPKLKLSRAYELMANCLREPRRSHPYGALSGKSGHKPPKGNDPEVAHLATLCKDRAVDQEAICDPWPGNLVIQPYIFEDS